MYENNNTVTIDWKGLFIKVIIVALIVFAIFKGYEYFSNNKGKTSSNTSSATQLFNANLESLRQAGENYYDYSNYPAEGQTVMVTLSELITKGNIKELYDDYGNECNRENSYVSLTNDSGQYKLKATLSCGQTSNYTVVMIGCECEGDECTQAINKLKDEKDEKETSDNKATNSNTSSNKNNSSNSNNTSNNNVNVKKTTQKTTTQKVVYEQPTQPTTKAPTKPTTKYVEPTKQQYKITFNTNGGDYINPQYVDKYDTAYEPADPDRDNDRFVGWYYNGRLFDFDTRITKNITLDAYYWTKDTTTTTVYSAMWDTYGTTYATVTHKLAIPSKLQEGVEDGTIKNVRIKKINNVKSMSTSYDLYYHGLYHRSTYDGYNYTPSDNAYRAYSATDYLTLGRLYNINAKKTYSYTYDRWVTWTANVSSQCSATFDGYHCNYGIVYNVVWEYDEFTN